MDYRYDYGRRWRIYGALMDDRMILIGGGSFARELINWFDGSNFYFVGYLSNKKSFENYSYDLMYLGKPEDYVPQEDDLFVVAIADPETKKSVVDKMRCFGARFATIVHPSAAIAKTAVLGEGCIVCPQSVVSADATLSDFVTVNVLSSVGHDVAVGKYSTLSSHVDLTGFVEVGEGVFLGTGAKVLPKLKIGNSAKIGAGSIVVRNVQEGVVMYAMPAKRL
jgi:sugar O-acyltransferase (sialic acid O-acetyltransferase NeuD family)